ncbi:MAG: class II aldolase/adducin family protein [Geminicoccaceae bacterium]|nr:class II aldolase/adducin family protein [Geminicoccaceae bacterium]MCX8102550.1 class II aldolase/adducin family protein [Geminicoccaceae bacterium]
MASRSLRARELRGAIVEACRWLVAAGLVQGTSGNVSMRWKKRMLITPSGVPYERMTPEDVVEVPLEGDGSVFEARGGNVPSSEWRFHFDILRARPEVGAVVHTHSPYATAFAICRKELVAAHYMIAAAGGPTIRVADYATFGTQALSDAALAALEGRAACLLANHGVIATGPTLERALWLAQEVEVLARQYAIALQLGHPVILEEEEILRVVEKFKGYGPRKG